MEDNKKKYIPMENVLNAINSKTIALSNKEKKRNNKILEQVISVNIINLMKQKDQLFKAMYERNYYGGSYYDDLKVGNPNEYDLDLILNLPVLSKPCVETSEQPGFVQVKIDAYFDILNKKDAKTQMCVKMDTWLDEFKYLSTDKVLVWMERVINLVLNEMPKQNGETYVNVILDNDKPDQEIKILVKLSKGGPAFTLKLSGTDIDGSDIQLDIDLVPCFQFTNKDWPKNGGYRRNTSTTRDKFLVVPKKPKDEIIKKPRILERYWRLSFQEQERELIGQDLKVLKPSVRLLKKLRDKHNHKIASYFIKTIFLWTLEEEDKAFWVQPLSVVFMEMLKKYAKRLRQMNIPYYWNSKFNLIGSLKDSTKIDIANTLDNIIGVIERNLILDPFIVGKYLLMPAEFEKLKEEVSLGKKFEKNSIAAITRNNLSTSTIDTTDSQSDSPPLVKVFKFEPDMVNTIKDYCDSLAEKSRHEFEGIMAQVNNRTNGFSNNDDVLVYLKRIDEKMDQTLGKFDKFNDNVKDINSKIASLEEQVKQLQLENKALKSRLNETENVDSIAPFLNIRQIENNFTTTTTTTH